MRLIAFTVAAIAAAAAAAQEPTTDQTAEATATECALDTLEPEAALAADCVSCHEAGHASAQSHRVGIDYALAAFRSKGALRPLDDVRARGVRVPEGRVECVTCHDPTSPRANHVALPAGATAKPAVILGVESTYGEEDVEPPAPAAGAEVSAKPLCVACHRFD